MIIISYLKPNNSKKIDFNIEHSNSWHDAGVFGSPTSFNRCVAPLNQMAKKERLVCACD